MERFRSSPFCSVRSILRTACFASHLLPAGLRALRPALKGSEAGGTSDLWASTPAESLMLHAGS